MTQLTLNFNPPTYTIRQAIDDYIAERGVNWRPATVTTHKSRLNLFAKWLDGCAIVAPENITYRHIADHLSGFKAKSWYARKASFEALRSFFIYLKVTGRVEIDVFSDGQTKGLLKLPRQPRLIKTVVGDDVIKQAISLAEAGKTVMAYRDSAMLRLMTTTGIRRGELVRIELDDVDFSVSPVAISISGKGGDSRMVYPTANTLASLLKWLKFRPETSCNRLFVGLRHPHCEISGEAVNNAVMKWAGGNRVTTRKLRDRYATQFVKNGGSVAYLAELMGHDNVATTQRYLANHLPDITRHALASAPEI